MENQEQKSNIDQPLAKHLENIYLFKVSDYTTILLGIYDKEKDCFYVQRGDGVKYEYDEYRIVWRQKLNYH